MPETWVVVPVFNESQVIGDVIRELRKDFADVVCVDDGSSDQSASEARDAGAIVVRHAVNLGQGAAIQTGLSYVLRDPGMRYVITFDADGQHQCEDALAMLERLRADEADVVFGSRFLDKRTKVGVAKRALLRGAILYSNATTHVRLTDTHNGLRALNRKAAQTLNIRQDRMAHASEIVTQVGAARLRWVEHPVHILYTDYSTSKGQSMLNAINIIVDLIVK